MNTFASKTLNKICAILAIFMLTISDFLILGNAVVTYAIDVVQTNHVNVDFSAYFLDDNQDKVESIEKSINEEEYLYVDISVKNEGYFKGKINLNNNNFIVKDEKLSPEIAEISENTVTLKQINAGSTVTIKLKVEPIKQNNIEESILTEKTNVVLQGQYTNSRNVEKNQYVDIRGTTNVQMNLKSSEQSQAELQASLMTNSVYEINEETKKVVQVLINSKLTDNNYPVKNTVIETDLPENAEEVKVFARNTDATNSNIVFGEGNYTVSGNKLTINVENADQDNVSWNKNVKDTFVVTYILPEDTSVQNTDISVKSTLTTYDNKTFSANQDVHINKVIDGIINATTASGETSIYKGKIYSGEERDYTVHTKLNINYLGIAQSAQITDSTKYMSNGVETESNITIYKQTKIDKAEFLRIFGDQGYITIKNDAGTIVKNINKDSNTDLDGKIITTYGARTQNIEIETSEPKTLGTLNIENTKTIVNKTVGEDPKPIYNREKVKLLTEIKESVTSSYNNTTPIVNSNEITLLETTSKAELKVEPRTLSSTEKNEDVKITAVLVNNDESKDLFSEPTIKITLPKQIKSFHIDNEIFNGKGLELPEEAVYEKIDGEYVLTYNLQNSQTEYNTKDVEGTTLIIYADLETEEIEEDTDAEIKMTYTNDWATEYEDGGVQKAQIKIYGSDITEEEKVEEDSKKDDTDITKEAKIVSRLKAYVGNKELQKGDGVYTGEIVKYELTIENEGTEEAKDVEIEASIPKNVSVIKYVKGIDNGYEKDGQLYGSFDYYENVETKDEKITEKIGTINAKEKRTLIYEVKINDEAANTSIQSNVKTRYNDSKETTTNTIESQVSKAELEMTIAMQARASKDLVYSGKTYSYYLNIKNVSDKKVSNINIEAITDSCTIQQIINRANKSSINYENNAFEIKSINAGETVTYEIDVKIDQNVSKSSISAVANNSYRSNKVEETVKFINYSVSMEAQNENQVVGESDKIVYKSVIKNTGNTEIRYIEFSQILSTYLNIEKVKVNGNEIEYNTTNNLSEEFGIEESGICELGFSYENKIEKDEKIEISIEMTPNSEIKHTNDMPVFSIAKANTSGKTRKTEQVEHILKANDEIPAIEQEKEELTEEKYLISGIAWLDENEDGRRDAEEQILPGVKVELLNLDNRTVKSVETEEKGFYSFNNLENGKYIAIFEYDTDKYMLTKYKSDEVSENRNSDVENLTLNIKGESKTFSATDTFEINGSNITNIDLGLQKAKTFDLELDKSITKIIITNDEGTKTKEYNESKLVKAEVDAKYIKGTTILVEYKIKVTNKGEIAGYAKNIVDYKPTDLSFNSNLNTEWYQSGDYLYSTSLKDTKIEPGETKELKLILTKTMTESNIGLVNNMAEIKEDYNQLGIADKDSTPGNKEKSEDDLGSSNFIISVSTGAAVSFVLLTMSVLAVVAVVAYIISRKISK